MKKLNFVALTLSACLLFSACGAKPDGGAEQEADALPEAGLQVDENLLTVDILFPASFYEDTDMSTFDPEAYAEENGFKKVVVNEDGTVLVTMSKAKHREIMDDLLRQIEESYAEIVRGEDTEYVAAIDHTDDFRKISIVVDREGFDNAGIAAAFLPLQLYVQSSMYQIFNGDEIYSEISFVDASTNKVMSSVVYPDAFASLEDE